MNKSVLIAIIIAILTAAWLYSGTLGDDAPAEPAQSAISEPDQSALEGNSNNKLTEVRIRDLTAEMMVDEVKVTGRTRASRTVDIKAETMGRVQKLHAEKGDIVTKGAPLLTLNVKDRAARVTESQQLVNQRQIQYDAALELQQKGFNSRVRLAEARAQLESAKSALKQARVSLGDTSIKAPFSGVINNQYIELGDYVATGQNLLNLVDLNPIEISGFVTEKQVTQIMMGAQAAIQITGIDPMTGRLSYIASAADPETRTFEIEIEIPNDNGRIKEGLTASVTIPMQQKLAYRISPSILTLTDEGVVGVKILDENNVVQFKPITLLRDTPDYLWVSGLPDTIRLITVGQEFVLEGQKVKPIMAQGEGLL